MFLSEKNLMIKKKLNFVLNCFKNNKNNFFSRQFKHKPFSFSLAK